MRYPNRIDVYRTAIVFIKQLGKHSSTKTALLAKTLRQISARFPKEIVWILRVDGHTDRRPISTYEFASNWELSTSRNISVVKHLIAQGIPSQRLAATGFQWFLPTLTRPISRW